MKKCIALTMCLFLYFCTTVLIYPKQETNSTEYYASEFNGASEFTTKTFTVTYAERTPSGKSLALRTPDYIVPNVTCVPIAGANLLGYYDRFCTELIPNFTPGVYYVGTYYVYNAYDDNVTNAALQLASDMGLSDPSTQGATVAMCKTGFEKYCQRKSLSVNFTTSMKSRSFSYDLAKSQIDAGKPVIVFCSKFNVTTMSQITNADKVVMHISSDPHAMVVFGYTEITYKLSDGSTQTYKYLNAATGVNLYASAYIYIGSDITIDDAYAVTIS